MKRMGITRKGIFVVGCSVILLAFIAAVLWLFIPHRSILSQSSGTQDSVYNENYLSSYIQFRTSDGETLSGWFFNRGTGKELVMCFPGNSCNAGMFAVFAEADSARSYLMLNYRGYGNSSGTLTEENMVDDACEALSHFSSTLQTDEIKLLGFSLGTGVAIQVAARNPNVKQAILVAPFDSMASVCNLSGIWKWGFKDLFMSVDYAPNLQCAVNVVYSEEDRTVRPESTRRLLQKFVHSVEITRVNGNHSQVISDPDNQFVIQRIICDNQ